MVGTLSVIGVVGTGTFLLRFDLARVECVICHLGVYLCLTAYGAWAVHKFIGTEYVTFEKLPKVYISNVPLISGCSTQS